MLRNFGIRTILPVGLAITGFVVMGCTMLYSVIHRDMTEEARRHTAELADTVSRSLRYAMLKDDRASLHNIIDNVGKQDLVKKVRIYNPEQKIVFSAAREEIGRQRQLDAARGASISNRAGFPGSNTFLEEPSLLNVVTPIPNEPECLSSCHFHDPDARHLGFLDVGLSREPLNQSLDILRTRMTTFSVLILILTVGGVAILLAKKVLAPLTVLDELTERLASEEQVQDFTTRVHESGNLGYSIQRLAMQRDEARAELERLRNQSTEGED
ncbi:MAG: hypothetical protein R6V08_00375 [Desulfuromonadales bacterium]